MENFTIGDILKAAKGHRVEGNSKKRRRVEGNFNFVIGGISTDTRTLKQGDLFIALSGERFDGHDFIPQAISRGAAGVIVSRNVGKLPVSNIILVEDTTQALGDIARFYRSRFNIPVIGLTGSNGKTTTKDMTALVLSQKYNVLKSEGNFNNFIGVPLTLFRLSRAHEIAVIEMGTGAPGEMSRLVEIAQPDMAVVTNVSATHLEYLGTIDGVAVEKSVLARAVSSAVLNADDPRVAKMHDGVDGTTVLFGVAHTSIPACKADTTGRDAYNTVLAADIGQDREGRSEFTLVTDGGKTRIHLQSLGRHNIYNALAAASVGILFHVELDDIKKALESYKGISMRMQKVFVDGATVINDTYNSNPASLKAAVDFLSGAECDGKKIAVVGDMLELGELSDELHREAGRFIAGSSIHELVTVGDGAAKSAAAAIEAGMTEDRVSIYRTNKQAAAHLRETLSEGDIVLIKGSRGVKMEEIVRDLSINQ